MMNLPPINKISRAEKNFARVMIAFVMAGWLTFAMHCACAADDGRPASARQLYNDGTKKLGEGKLQEAESCLQSAIASQDEIIQPPALYNLGEVRFKEGIEEFKKGPNAQAVAANSRQAVDSGDGAIRAADQAMAGDDLQVIVSAYLRGKGARRELKAASEAVKHAMETYGGVLAHWQRSSGDFKSTFELAPSDTDAKTNADVVDRSIAQLVDLQQMLKQAQGELAKKRAELNKKLAGLKGRMPDNQGEKFDGKGEDDDDEDEDKPSKQPAPGQQEPSPKNGKEMELSPDEAARLLDMLKLDGNRKLPLGTNDLAKPKAHRGRDW
jgi:hypothetical protein